MRKPSSVLRSSARRLHRPSPAMGVALVALFLSAGGASYAAVSLPAHSVGPAQLRTFAVTNPKIANNAIGYRKIMPGSIGTVRIVKNDVQLRLKNTCPSGQAMTAVDVNGKVSCAPAMGAEINSAPAAAVAVSSPTTAATVSALALPGGSAYMVHANPYITVKPSTVTSAAAQHVVVTCTLKAGTATTAVAQRSASFDLPQASATPAPQVETASIPLVVVAPSSATAMASDVTCVTSVTDTSGTNAGKASTDPATATAQGQIYATQVASVTTGTATIPTTTTTTTTTPTPAP